MDCSCRYLFLVKKVYFMPSNTFLITHSLPEKSRLFFFMLPYNDLTNVVNVSSIPPWNHQKTKGFWHDVRENISPSKYFLRHWSAQFSPVLLYHALRKCFEGLFPIPPEIVRKHLDTFDFLMILGVIEEKTFIILFDVRQSGIKKFYYGFFWECKCFIRDGDEWIK